MASFTGQLIKDTYDAILKAIDNGVIDSTAKNITDGVGNVTPLYISTTQVGIGVTPSTDFHVNGSALIGGSLTITGDLTVNGSTTTISTQTLSVEDPLIILAKDNAANSVDIGFYGKYVDGSTKYAGLFRKAGDNKFHIFSGLGTEPTTTVNTSDASYVISTLVGNLEGNVTGNIIATGAGATQIMSDVRAVTQSANDNSTKIATTAYVDTSAGNYLPLAGGTMSGNIAMGANNITNVGSITIDNINIDGNTITSTTADFTIDASHDIILDAAGGNIDFKDNGLAVARFLNSSGDFIILTQGSDKDILFKGNDGGSEITALTLDMSEGGNATFNGDITVSGGDITLSGTGRIQGIDTVSASTDAASKGYVDSQVGANNELSEVLANGNTTGGTDISVSAGDDILFSDSSRAKFGDSGSDLQIYHDGNNSWIRDDGTGDFFFTSNGNGFYFQSETGENLATFLKDSTVKLYYDNAQKFQTTTSGIEVTGDADVSGNVFVGGANSNFSENNLRFKSAGAAYIDHNTVGQSFIFRTSASSSLDTTALTIASDADSTFAGSVGIGGAPDNLLTLTGTAGTTHQRFKEASTTIGFIGGANGLISSHDGKLAIRSESGLVLGSQGNSADVVISSGNATFAGSIQSNGTFIELDSPSDALLIIDRAATSNVARLSWRNAGSEYFRAGIETTNNDLWSLLHTCGSGLYFDGTAMTFGFGRSPQTGITLPQGSGAANKISWYDVSDTFAASIYGNSSTDKLTFATKNSSNTETIALEIDTSQNSTFTGKVGVGGAPDQKLTLKDSGNLYMHIDRTSGAQVYLGATDAEGLLTTSNSFPLIIKTNNTTHATFNADRTTTFAGNIHVDVINNAANSANIIYRSGTQTIVGGGSSTQKVKIEDNGSIYNSTSNPTYENTYYGHDAGRSITSGTSNTFLGSEAGEDNTTGAANTFVGAIAGYETTTGSHNTALGYFAFKQNVSGGSNVALGSNALKNNTSGIRNIAIGYDALASYTTGQSAIGIGFNAGYSLVSATGQIAIGQDALYDNSGGVANTAVGYASLTNATSNYNTAFGYETGLNTTTGSSNTFMGLQAGYHNSTGSNLVAIGESAGFRFTTGSNNVGIGSQVATANNVTGDNNTSVGHSSGRYLNTGNSNSFFGAYSGENTSTGSLNAFIGLTAGQSNTSGTYNTALGASALKLNTTGSYFTAIGYNTLASASAGASDCTAVGAQSQAYNTAGLGNTSLGYFSMHLITSGDRNTAIGHDALRAQTTSGDNTAVGYTAGDAITSGGANTIMGSYAGTSITTGNYNMAIGTYAALSQTTATNNMAIGFQALRNNQTAGVNIAIGAEAMYSNTGGVYNTVVGYQSLYYNTSSSHNSMFGLYAGHNAKGSNNTYLGSQAGFGSGSSTGSYNTLVGHYAGYSSTTANYNTFVGNIAGQAITTGGNNTGVGHEACRFLTTGTINTVIGLSALENGTTAYENVAVGYRALRNCSTGAGNIALGLGAGINITTGGSNIAIGYSAMGSATVTGGGNIALGDASGYALTSGANNVLIGKNSGRNTSGTDSLGHVTSGSNEIQIGNKTHTSAKVNISWTIVSDKRDKTKIKELDKGLDFVENLKPVSYERTKNRETKETDNKERYGFLAQDVLELEGEKPVIVNNEDKDNLKLTSDYIIPILVNAIKELKQEIEILKSK